MAHFSNFEVEPKTYQAPAAEDYEGIEVPVNVKYEPSTWGDSKALLIVSPKIAHISITFTPTPILSPHIRAIQTPNRPNMPSNYTTW